MLRRMAPYVGGEIARLSTSHELEFTKCNFNKQFETAPNKW